MVSHLFGAFSVQRYAFFCIPASLWSINLKNDRFIYQLIPVSIRMSRRYFALRLDLFVLLQRGAKTMWYCSLDPDNALWL